MKCKLLVVDDDHAILRVLDRQFKDEFNVTTCSDVASALAIVGDFDAVVSDFSMPGGNGYDVVRAATAKGVPVVLHTGSPGIRHTWVVCKPASKEDLIAAVRAALKK